MIPIPEALAGVFDQLAETRNRARKLIETHCAEELNWQPAGRAWSALQCIRHLAMANRLLATSVERALQEQPRIGPASERIAPGLLWRFLLAMVEPRCRLRGFAPRVLQPPELLDAASTLAEYEASHDRLRALAQECRGCDLDRMRLAHPILRLPMSIGSVFLLASAHERRHLHQAERAARARYGQNSVEP